jgi:predicted amidohydrolase
MPKPPRDGVHLGLIKAVPRRWEPQANLEHFLGLLDQAARAGAELVVTPEAWLDGYAAADRGSTPERLRTMAQEPGASPYLAEVARQARSRSLWICFGFSSLEGGRVYNAAGLWNARGRLVGIYHKTHLQNHDLQYTPGAALPVWPTPWGPVGILICADRRWPETARVLRLQGARLILLPTYGMHHEGNEWWMRTRSYENQCFVAFTHPRVAFVTGPEGGLEAKLEGEEPGVLAYQADLSRARDNNHLQDRRPELYGAITAPKPPAPGSS